jgi:hypothetical protein
MNLPPLPQPSLALSDRYEATKSYAESYGVACYRAALEEAAKVCEAVDLHDGDHLKNSDPRATCAAAIRALGDK